MVEKQPLLPLGVVENLPLIGFFLHESKKVVETEARFQEMWLKTYKPPNPVGENAPVGVEYELGVIGHERETECGV